MGIINTHVLRYHVLWFTINTVGQYPIIFIEFVNTNTFC